MVLSSNSKGTRPTCWVRFPGPSISNASRAAQRSRAGGQPLRRPGSWPESRRPESRLTPRVSARTPRRKACSQWRTWKCRLMHRRDDPDHAERPRAPLGGNKGIGGDEGFNDMIRTEASVAVFEVLCLDLLAESKILPLARRP